MTQNNVRTNGNSTTMWMSPEYVGWEILVFYLMKVNLSYFCLLLSRWHVQSMGKPKQTKQFDSSYPPTLTPIISNILYKGLETNVGVAAIPSLFSTPLSDILCIHGLYDFNISNVLEAVHSQSL